MQFQASPEARIKASWEIHQDTLLAVLLPGVEPQSCGCECDCHCLGWQSWGSTEVPQNSEQKLPSQGVLMITKDLRNLSGLPTKAAGRSGIFGFFRQRCAR